MMWDSSVVQGLVVVVVVVVVVVLEGTKGGYKPPPRPSRGISEISGNFRNSTGGLVFKGRSFIRFTQIN